MPNARLHTIPKNVLAGRWVYGMEWKGEDKESEEFSFKSASDACRKRERIENQDGRKYMSSARLINGPWVARTNFHWSDHLTHMPPGRYSRN